MSKIDGGPAFPRAPFGMDNGHPYGQQNGMSLRDWFAGQALAGWLASYTDGTIPNVGDAASFAYELADAMIKARKGGGS